MGDTKKGKREPALSQEYTFAPKDKFKVSKSRERTTNEPNDKQKSSKETPNDNDDSASKSRRLKCSARDEHYKEFRPSQSRHMTREMMALQSKSPCSSNRSSNIEKTNDTHETHEAEHHSPDTETEREMTFLETALSIEQSAEADETRSWRPEMYDEQMPPWYYPRTHDDLHYAYSKACTGKLCMSIRFFSLSLPITLGAAGFMNTDNCPLHGMISIWAMVTSILWILHAAFFYLMRNNKDRYRLGYKFVRAVFLYTCYMWWIVGSGVILGTVKRINVSDPKSEDFCDPMLYLSSALTLTLSYFAVAIGLFFYIFTFVFTYHDYE